MEPYFGRWGMKRLAEILVLGGAFLLAVLVPALELARHGVDILAPLYFVLLVIGTLLYLLPALLAGYRNSQHATSITIVNLLLGWTIVGWVICLGWAAYGHESKRIDKPAHSLT